MNNKLEELKRKLLEQQLSKDKNAVHSNQGKSNNKDSPVKQNPADSPHLNLEQNNSKNSSNQNLNKSPEPPIISSPDPQRECQGEVANLEHQQQNYQHQQISNHPQILEQKSIVLNDPIEEGKAQLPEVDKLQNTKVDKNKQEALNLDLVDKHANISCSIDQQGGASVPIPEKLHYQENLHKENLGQSKQQKKHKKIVLKQLLMVKECVKNLQSALKGLQIIQTKIAADPSVKQRIKYYLNELSSAKFLNE